MFSYMQTEQVRTNRGRVGAGIASEFRRVEPLDPGLYGITSQVRRILETRDTWVSNFAQAWLTDAIDEYERAINARTPENAEQLLNDLEKIRSKIRDMTIPKIFDDTEKPDPSVTPEPTSKPTSR